MRKRRRPDGGQATVEFAVVIPLVLLAVLMVVQVAVISYTQLSVTFTAREAARVVAADPTASLAELAASERIEIVVERPGPGHVRVRVRAEIEPVVGLFAPVFEGRSLESVVQVATE